MESLKKAFLRDSCINHIEGIAMGENDQRERARSLLLANITHEFRTPIQTILATLDLLNETNLTPEQSEYAQQIHFAAESLLSLVNDFLDFSKLEAGQFRFEYIPFNPLSLVEQTVELLAIEAFNKGIEIITDIDYALPSQIIADPTRIRQVLLNLLKNAVKFTNKGYVQVNIFADQKAKTITVQVKDSGIGISDENKKKLFTDFYQTDASNTRKYGGTGLGLAISKNFVEKMGGTIGMEDNPDGGSIFYFTLPYKEPEGGCVPEVDVLEKSLTQNQKLLIVDDQTSAADSMKKKLQRLGFENVTAVNSGKDALQCMREAVKEGAPFTQIYIDMIMPVMDGWRLSFEINQDSSINVAKLYLLIPEGQMGGDARMKRLKWFNNYLYKPIKKTALISLISESADECVELLPEEPVAAPVSVPGVYERIAEGKNILVAEDHPVNQKLIKTFFQQFGATTICVSDGKQAVDEAAKHPEIDIIFMDIQMPVMCGVDAVRLIREHDQKTPIIACTANTDEADFKEYFSAGMNGVLIKPFKKQSVYNLLQDWFSRSEFKSQKIANEAENEKKKNSVWNTEEFESTISNDLELAVQLLQAFDTQTISLLDKVKDFLPTADFSVIRQCAHTIKGSAATLSIHNLADIAKQMEIVAKAQSIEACETCYKEAMVEFTQFQKMCEQWMSEHGLSF